MNTPYSRRPEVVAAVPEFLVSVRDRPDDQMPRHGEVAVVYGGIARAVAPVLNSVARDCGDAGEPDLSALVVLADSGPPGRQDASMASCSSPQILERSQRGAANGGASGATSGEHR